MNETADLDAMIGVIVDELAPALVARNSIGRESAAQFPMTAGDNCDRIESEASFVALCGVSPVPAPSGEVARHSLNRAEIEPPTVRFCHRHRSASPHHRQRRLAMRRALLLDSPNRFRLLSWASWTRARREFLAGF